MRRNKLPSPAGIAWPDACTHRSPTCPPPCPPARQVRATVDEPCPRCKHPVLEYYTMQLRSADEGQVGQGARGLGLVGTGWGARVLAVGAQPSRPSALTLFSALAPLPPVIEQTVFYECRKCDYRYSTNN